MHSGRMHTLHCSARLGGLCVCLGGLPRGCGWCRPWGCTPPPCGQNSQYMLVTSCNEVVVKVVFTHVCDSVHRGVCLSARWDTTPQEQTPRRADAPWEQTPPWSRHPPGADTPWSRHPPPRSRHPPWEQTPLE